MTLGVAAKAILREKLDPSRRRSEPAGRRRRSSGAGVLDPTSTARCGGGGGAEGVRVVGLGPIVLRAGVGYFCSWI